MEHATPPRRKTRLERVIAGVVVWIGVGVFLNWAMTWSAISLYWIRADLRDFESTDTPGAWPVAVPMDWPIPTEASWMDYDWWSLTAYSTGVPRFAYILYDGSEASEPRFPRPMNDRAELFAVGMMKAGFPARSFGCIIRESPGCSDVRGALMFHLPKGRRTPFPFQPLWPGFAVNTLFYAAIAWGLWRIPIFIRRYRRRGRGLCLRCAYDRAGLAPGAACPECGHVPGPGASVISA